MMPSNAARRLALLEEAVFVDDQHGIALGQRLKHIVAHNIAQRVGIPVAAAQHCLLAPRTDAAGGLRPHPARLAPLWPKQRVKESHSRGQDARVIDQPTQSGLGFPQFGRSKLQKIFNGNTAHRISPKSWSTGRRP
jgi:hypothetical protein